MEKTDPILADVDSIPELEIAYSEGSPPGDYQGYLSVLAATYLQRKRYKDTSPLVPHRALPNHSGEIHRVLPLTGKRADRDMRKHYASWMEPYLDFSAHLLMHTDIAVRDAGFPSAPSVLIITSSYDNYTTFSGSGKGRDLHGDYSFSGLRKFMGTNEVGRLSNVYGRKLPERASAKKLAVDKAELAEAYLWAYKAFSKIQGSDHLKKVQKSTWNRYKSMRDCAAIIMGAEQAEDHLFSELSFLDSIFIDRGTGIHYFDNMPSTNDYLISLHLEAARKFFDIVIISPTITALVPESLVTRAYGIDPADVARYEHFTYVGLAMSMPDAVLQHQNAGSGDLILPQPGMTGDYTANNIALMSRDFASALLGVHARSRSVLDFAPKQDFLIRHGIKQMNSSDLVSKGAIAAPLAGGLLITGTALGISISELSGVVQDAAMALSVLPTMITAGLSSKRGFKRFAHKNYSKNEASLNNRVFKTIINTEGFYSFRRVPVHQSVAAKAYGHRSLLYPKGVQKVQIGDSAQAHVVTVSSLDSSAPAQSVGSGQRILPWRTLVERADALTKSWMSYELDPMKSLDFPLMLDPSCKETGDFIRAMREMESWKEQGQDKRAEFAQALQEAEDAFAVAETNARKSRLAHLNTEEKKQVKKARDLVSIAKDDKASPNERRLALEQANQALEGVLPPLDPKVIGLIEAGERTGL